jgi:hypothetical protein
MAVPTAPAAGEPIAEAWGDVVHDAVVAQDIQQGTVSFAGGGAVAYQDIVVTFPRPFSAPPIVMVSAVSGTTPPNNVFATVSSTPTVTQFTLRINRRDGANTGFTCTGHWFAIGARA